MTYYSREPIALDRAIAAMPALSAMPHASRSSRYEHIPTSEVLRALGREGFEIHGLTTAKVRKDERNGVDCKEMRSTERDDDDEA